jgi:hypothetical protein
LDVNNDGLIVGYCFGAPGEFVNQKAVMWHNGTICDLFELIEDDADITELVYAASINSSGAIAVEGNVLLQPNHQTTVAIILNPCYPVIGDLNCDETVGPSDLGELLAQWGPRPDSPADFNDDGVVGPFDLAQLLAHWGP